MSSSLPSVGGGSQLHRPSAGQSGVALDPLIVAVEFGDDRVERVDQPEPLGRGRGRTRGRVDGHENWTCQESSLLRRAVRGKYVSPEGEVHAHCRFRLEANDFRRAVVRMDTWRGPRRRSAFLWTGSVLFDAPHRALFLLRNETSLFPVFVAPRTHRTKTCWNPRTGPAPCRRISDPRRSSRLRRPLRSSPNRPGLPGSRESGATGAEQKGRIRTDACPGRRNSGAPEPGRPRLSGPGSPPRRRRAATLWYEVAMPTPHTTLLVPSAA